MGLMRTLAATFAAGEAGVLWDRIGPMESEIAGVFASLFKQLNVSRTVSLLKASIADHDQEENLVPNYMFETDAALSESSSSRHCIGTPEAKSLLTLQSMENPLPPHSSSLHTTDSEN